MSNQANKVKFLTYPERIRSRLERTGEIVFIDGQHVTPSQIWQFMTEEAPKRFPYAYDTKTYNIVRLSDDVDFVSGIKYNYIELTWRDRMLAARSKGIPLILNEGGGQTRDPYYAAGAIPLRPGAVSTWVREMEDGLDLHQIDLRNTAIMESGRKLITIEACNQIGAHAAISDGVVDVDMLAPFLCLRCSDVAYLVEKHRSSQRSYPLQLIDYPINNQVNKEWAVEYFASNLKRLIASILNITSAGMTEDGLKEEIKLHNKMRRLALDIHELWWSANIPPTNSTDFNNIRIFGNDPCGVSAISAISILEETKQEVHERIKNSIKGAGLTDDPVRLFACGSCVSPNPTVVDRAGGVVVGKDDWLSGLYIEVKENGNPYGNLAKANLSISYEQPIEVRALWTVEQIKKSKADGMIFMHQWGCNYQSAVSRMVADIVKEKAGIPTLVIEVDELDKAEALEQSQNRVESFIEMLR
ncbi:MAG TPA: 2-hydroxyacyl-CoA dehydratase [Candidatus Methanoperedenaceae archaeon]|nr:2-hydroxyacyl-CoA dehydratase [Candidatus Methanoperedenaceae archaeon]